MTIEFTDGARLIRLLPRSLILLAGMGTPTPELERRFFTKLRLPNGTYKTTYRKRLDDLNDALLGVLPARQCLRVMDVAVSSGISTAEWSDQLLAHGFPHELVAGDLLTEVLLTSFGMRLALLMTAEREPLLLEIGPVMVPLRSDRRLIKAARRLLRLLLRTPSLRRGLSFPGPPMAPAKPWRWVHRRASLVSAELRERPTIELVQDDILIPGQFLGAFDVVRVANLVQRVYFDDATLRVMLGNLRDRLQERGLLVVCRTLDDGQNHATILERAGDHLVVKKSLNGGSEVVDLLVAL